MNVLSSIASGISKKSFFKGFLSRGGSTKNDIGGNTSSHSQNRSSGIGKGSNQMQSTAMNVMAFKNNKNINKGTLTKN
jgi:hypothetical protein